jgi:hypothetical protein
VAQFVRAVDQRGAGERSGKSTAGRLHLACAIASSIIPRLTYTLEFPNHSPPAQTNASGSTT